MGDNSIHYMGHVKMMAAVQPFLSGAISKTVNMPEEATVEDVEQLHIEAWKLGLKAVAIYRDNCKVGQPLSMAKKEGATEAQPQPAPAAVADSLTDRIIVKGAVRRELPKTRAAKTFSFKVGDSKGYMTIGEYDDGTPGEIFVNVSKQGSTLRGILDAFAISLSHGLQFGVPLKDYVKSFTSMSFAPAGITDDPEIRTASSIIDYIARRLALSYLSFDDRLELGLASIEDMPDQQQTSFLETDLQQNEPAAAVVAVSQQSQPVESPQSEEPVAAVKADTAPLCFNCGNQTQRSGSCYVCTSCGSTTGCS
jgi:ribonucleoside-diphosphate reductase alpha chain